MVELLWDGPDDASVTLLLAHGAGAAMDSAGMNAITSALVEQGIRVARFEFAYMAGRRQGVRKPPPRGDSLQGEYLDAVADVTDRPLLIGGHSMGGRVASMVAQGLYDAGTIAGLVCFSYPFHPPAKPEQLRTAHLIDLTAPTQICQGTRDEFGTPDEVASYDLPPAIDVHWLGDGDHSLRPRKAISGRTYAQNLAEAAEVVASFATRVTRP
ncbi:putative alpha/beta-hydrolase family hydrolase [Microbacteriaceae bacterium SG_E_30_P1]|uniref:Alpha/beta-hydrolase family hydrolase n=1 Tax=Antiquaquibacter oligotrophicus TaxID=2880260 RepID=A0ABT6KQP8_9MICO|nr:alpha/beta fold hydrolase [Antiquaquibacter oligotrophicus]MDH6181524.1 putative alpha/beta-hydrolase family hydrolase [Antiquaquibacter oligotrophicus]UDF12786.1 alpha/beta fold hydrolase [Antiquaquibacter oligotrophicus]